jgi:hypothetical protein
MESSLTRFEIDHTTTRRMLCRGSGLRANSESNLGKAFGSDMNAFLPRGKYDKLDTHHVAFSTTSSFVECLYKEKEKEKESVIRYKRNLDFRTFRSFHCIDDPDRCLAASLMTRCDSKAEMIL